MLEFLRQSLEADAAKRGEQLLSKLQSAQVRHQAFWGSYLTASAAAFCLVLVGRIAAATNPAHITLITIGAVSLATVLVAATQHVIRDYAFLNKVAIRYQAYQTRLRACAQTDYLLVYRCAAWLLSLLPSAVAIV